MLGKIKNLLGSVALDVTESPNRPSAPGAGGPAAGAAPPQRKSHRRRILVWLVAVFALLAAAGLYVSSSVSRFTQEAEAVEHTHEVIRVVEVTFSGLKDVESANRGFVVTGNTAFLDQSEVARQNLGDGFARLKSLVADNPEQIRRAVSEMKVSYLGQQLGSVTASLGVAAFPEQGETVEALIHRADAALYLAKKGGRNRVVQGGKPTDAFAPAREAERACA